MAKQFYEKIGFWKAAAIILFIVLVMNWYTADDASKPVEQDKDIIEARVTKFLQQGFGDIPITIHSSVDQGQVYAIDLTVDTERATMYASKDGRFLFPGAVDMTGEVPLSPSPTTWTR